MLASAALQKRRQKAGGALLVTADHGNCETMRDPETGGPHTAHTTNPVQYCCWRAVIFRWQRGGSRMSPPLARVDGLSQPTEMTGRSLLRAVRASDQMSLRPSTSAIE